MKKLLLIAVMILAASALLFAAGGQGNPPSQGGQGNPPSQGGQGNPPSQGGQENPPPQGAQGNPQPQGEQGDHHMEGGHGGPGMEMGGPDRIMDLIDDMNLSSDQMKKIQDIRSASKKQAIKLKSDIEIAEIEIQDQFRSDNPDQGKIDASIDKISAAGSKLLKQHMADMLQIKKILTKEQFQKLMAKIDRHKRAGAKQKEKK